MCKFCTEHGDGKIWYKNAKNYAQDLVSDLQRRQYITQFLETTIRDGFASLGRLEGLYQRRGKLPGTLKRTMEERAIREHFGQVLPLEEIRELLMKADTIVRMPCACRWTIGRREERCCYGISFTPDAWYENLDMSYFGKAPSEGREAVGREEAVRQIELLDEAGAVHTIWTMLTPFIGAICNCSLRDCVAMKTLSGIKVETLARAEFVAGVDRSLCVGCGSCRERCQFDAIDEEQESGRVLARIDGEKCYGCGLCRNVCAVDAITLASRRG
ncbi:MAG TPA: 4Fe-4S dicluster-binding protein [Dissulfurispiraceae bacterium]|nr:4Fe-4S dicluster-binding protein [Dissulfurispiraceae bacterium]